MRVSARSPVQRPPSRVYESPPPTRDAPWARLPALTVLVVPRLMEPITEPLSTDPGADPGTEVTEPPVAEPPPPRMSSSPNHAPNSSTLVLSLSGSAFPAPAPAPSTPASAPRPRRPPLGTVSLRTVGSGTHNGAARVEIGARAPVPAGGSVALRLPSIMVPWVSLRGPRRPRLPATCEPPSSPPVPLTTLLPWRLLWVVVTPATLPPAEPAMEGRRVTPGTSDDKTPRAHGQRLL